MRFTFPMFLSWISLPIEMNKVHMNLDKYSMIILMAGSIPTEIKESKIADMEINIIFEQQHFTLAYFS